MTTTATIMMQHNMENDYAGDEDVGNETDNEGQLFGDDGYNWMNYLVSF